MIEKYHPVVWSENIDYFEKGDTQFIDYMQGMGYACEAAKNAINDLICKWTAKGMKEIVI